MSHDNLRYSMFIAHHGDTTFKDADAFDIPRFDSGTIFDRDRLVIESFNMADIWILFNEIVSGKEMIFAKETDITTVRLIQAFQSKKMFHYMAFVVWEEYGRANRMGELREIGKRNLEALYFTSVTITGLWPRIRDPNLPPDLAKIDTDVVTIKANLIQDIPFRKDDPATRHVLWQNWEAAYPQRRTPELKDWEKRLSR